MRTEHLAAAFQASGWPAWVLSQALPTSPVKVPSQKPSAALGMAGQPVHGQGNAYLSKRRVCLCMSRSSRSQLGTGRGRSS